MDAAFPEIRPAIPLTKQPVCCVAIDVEEDFDWDSPVQGTSQSTGHLRNLRVLVEILSTYKAVPTYLLTYPVLQDPEAVSIISHQLERGLCAAGLQLHPWVTPPFGEYPSKHASYLGNLDANQEEQKLLTLKQRFVDCFGALPTVYRAGRYGLSADTPRLLEKHGFAIDTSIAPRTNFEADGGPDYTDQDNSLFWFGTNTRLLEIPLCRGIVGWSGDWAAPLYRMLGATGERSKLMSLLARTRCAERITLSPEGNEFTAMSRLLRGRLAQGDTVFPLSFHSSSLQSGQNPYVRDTAGLHIFYDRLSETLDHMAGHLKFDFVALHDVPGLMVPEAAIALAPGHTA